MLIAGAVLLAVAVVLTAAAVTSNSHTVTFDLWGILHTHMSLGAVFIMGMVTTVIGVLGIVVLLKGGGRARARRKQQRKLEADQRKNPGALAAGDFDFGSFDTSARPTDPADVKKPGSA